MAFDRRLPNASMPAASPLASATVDTIITITAATRTTIVYAVDAQVLREHGDSQDPAHHRFGQCHRRQRGRERAGAKRRLLKHHAASATASQAYSSGARSSATKPPWTASTTPLVSTANNASAEPATSRQQHGGDGARPDPRAQQAQHQ